MIKNVLVCSLLVCATSSVFAETATASSNDLFQNAGLSLKAGTGGLGFDLMYSFDPRFKVRSGFSGLNYSQTINKSDMTQDGTLRLNNVDLLADYHPWSGGFRITGGLNVLDVNFKGHAEKTAGGFTTINGTPYSSTEVGSADLDVKWNGAKPYLGIGYDGFNSRQNAGLFFTTDFGVVFSGSPTVNLKTTCIASNPLICNNIDQDSKKQEDQLKKDLHSIQVLPIIQVGVGYRF
ncbi:MAG: hypothetical protein H7Z73_01190 [Candidatus Saccharibacteria bacterium]|nr:hypothetical protein [Moraxellaceae bacterium]